MLRSVIALTLLSLSFSSLAVDIKPCRDKSLKYLNESIEEAKEDGLKNVKLLRDSNKNVVGYYAWISREYEDARMGVCDSFSDFKNTVASEWFYWDNNASANPSKWKVGQVHRITQDEGGVDVKVLKASASGDVSLEVSVLGFGEDDWVVVRKQKLELSK